MVIDGNEITGLSGPEKKTPGLSSIMKLYLLVFLLFLFFAPSFQVLNLVRGMLLTQWLLIFLPAICYWRYYGVDRFIFSRLRRLELKFVPVILVLSVSFWFANLAFAAGVLIALTKVGFEPVVVLAVPETFGQYLAYLLALSFSAGVCEEVFFRGTVMPALEKEGYLPAIIFSSLLFAFLHGSLLSLVATFSLGAVMGVIVVKTGSLFGGILYHMLNNFFAVTYLFLAGKIEPAAEIDPRILPALLPLLLISLGGAYLGMKSLHQKSGFDPILRMNRGLLPRGWFGWPLVLSLLLFLFMAVFELATGFGWLNL